jgi:hypothetical protein
MQRVARALALVFFERANPSAYQVTDECSAPLCDEADRENGERIIDNRVHGKAGPTTLNHTRTVFDLNQISGRCVQYYRILDFIQIF